MEAPESIPTWIFYVAAIAGTILFVAALVSFGLWQNKRTARRVADAFRRMEMPFQVVDPTSEEDEIAYAARVEGIPLQVAFGHSDGESTGHSRVSFAWASPESISISPRSFLSRLGSLFGSSDLSSGDEEFDHQFHVRGSRDWLQSRQADKVTDGLFKLRLVAGPRVCLDAGPFGLIIRIENDLSRAADALNVLLNESIRIFKALRGDLSKPKAVVLPKEIAEEGKCPVCSTALGHEVVECNSCSTPHHTGCWSYLGGCAVFGCSLGCIKET